MPAEKLKQIIASTISKLEEIEEADFLYKASSKKWSKKEILGHLIDSAFNNHRRFILAQLQDDLVFEGYDQDKWVELNGYQNQSTDQLISTFRSLNLQIVRLISQIDASVLNTKTTNHNFHEICMVRVSEGDLSSIKYLIEDYIFHLEHHISQIVQ